MNKKGFTLVELLGVIVLLSVIGLIATVTISNELKENKEQLYNIQIDNIKRSAQTWASQHVFELPTEEGAYITLTLGQLKEANFSEDVVNPKTNEQFDNSLQIKITMKDNSYVYEVIE